MRGWDMCRQWVGQEQAQNITVYDSNMVEGIRKINLDLLGETQGEVRGNQVKN